MNLPKRKNLRLENFDYSSNNYYFVTVCTFNKMCLFGMPGDENLFRDIVEKELLDMPTHYENVILDRYVIMPNHIHAVVAFVGENTAGSRPRPTLMQVVGSFKSGAARKIHQYAPELPVWQSSFYDHVIRKQDSYVRIARYIEENPLRWEHDEYYQ